MFESEPEIFEAICAEPDNTPAFAFRIEAAVTAPLSTESILEAIDYDNEVLEPDIALLFAVLNANVPPNDS